MKVGGYVYVFIEREEEKEHRHKQTAAAEAPYRVIEANSSFAVTEKDDKSAGNISRSRIVTAIALTVVKEIEEFVRPMIDKKMSQDGDLAREHRTKVPAKTKESIKNEVLIDSSCSKTRKEQSQPLR